jgi:penicillin-binding protein 1B
MTVWGDMMRALAHEPLTLPQPENIERVWIDPETGLLADKECAGAVELPFVAGSAPQDSAPCARSVGGSIKNWFQRMFK